MEPDKDQGQNGAPPFAADGADGAVDAVLAGLEARLAAIVDARLTAEQTARRDRERRDMKERFAVANPEFKERKADGTLAALRGQNPLLNDVGAYFLHCLEKERSSGVARVEQARQEAAAETEKRLLERFKAKRLAATLGAGPATDRSGGGEPELAAPEKFGGINAVLAARLKARREAASI